jgi:hypothetical protein
MRFSLTTFAAIGVLVTFGATGAQAQTVTALGSTTPAASAENVGQSQVAVGTGSQATGQLSTATGSSAQATGLASTATGSTAQATGANSTATGVGALAGATGSSAYGYQSRALSAGDIASGANAQAGVIGGNGGNIAIGSDAGTVTGTLPALGIVANGGNAIAIGTAARSVGGASTAIGAYSKATSANSSAYGFQSYAGDPNSTAMGANSQAVGDGSTAIGANAATNGAGGSTAIGAGASAGFTNSTAIGAGAQATAANQVAIGTSSNTYKLAGLNSAASLAAQSGPVKVVTVDAAGNLAASNITLPDVSGLQSSVNVLQQQMKQSFEGTAIAISMGGSALPSDKRFAISTNWGNFRGQNAASVVAQMRVNDYAVVNVGVGAGFAQGGIGSRAGVTFAW